MDAGITFSGVDYSVQGKSVLQGVTLSMTAALLQASVQWVVGIVALFR